MKDMDDTVEISGEGAQKAANEIKDIDERDDKKGSMQGDKDIEGALQNVEAMQAELSDTKDRLLRQAAEFQNYKRRTEQEKNLYIRTGKEKVIQPMLDIFDDLTRSLDAARQAEEQEENLGAVYLKLREGFELVYEKFRNELTRLGVEQIEAVGKSFNEQEHEALLQQPAPDNIAPGTVLEEIQAGYRMGDKILRHSRVIVAS